MARLTLLFLSLVVWLTYTEGRSFPSRRFPINRRIPHSRIIPGKTSRDSTLSSKSGHMLLERNNLFARVAELNQFLRAFSKKVAKRDDEEQQQQQVVCPSQSPCEQIKAKLSTAIDIFYYLKDDWVASSLTALELYEDVPRTIPSKDFVKQYLTTSVCPIINAGTIEELSSLPPPANQIAWRLDTRGLDNFKLMRQAGYIDVLVPGFRSIIDAIEALVYELRDHGVTAPALDKPIIPTLRNYFTVAELQQTVGDVIDAYWDDLLPVASLSLSDVIAHYGLTAEKVKQLLNPYLEAVIDSKTLDEFAAAVGINPRRDPRAAKTIDAVVCIVATAPDEAFDLARIMVEIFQLILDNMALLQ